MIQGFNLHSSLMQFQSLKVGGLGLSGFRGGERHRSDSQERN